MTDQINKLVMQLKVLDKEQISIVFGYDLDEGLEEEDIAACTFILHGLAAILREQQSYVMDRGQHEFESQITEMLREQQSYVMDRGQHEFESQITEMIFEEIDEDEEIIFEPDEELLQAIKDSKVVPFKKTKLH